MSSPTAPYAWLGVFQCCDEKNGRRMASPVLLNKQFILKQNGSKRKERGEIGLERIARIGVDWRGAERFGEIRRDSENIGEVRKNRSGFD